MPSELLSSIALFLTELLESRAKQSSEKTYFEIDVFEEFGPWKADSYHYSNT